MKVNRDDLKKLCCQIACEMAYCGPLSEHYVGKEKQLHTYVYGYEVSKAAIIIENELAEFLETYEIIINTPTVG